MADENVERQSRNFPFGNFSLGTRLARKRHSHGQAAIASHACDRT